MGPTSGGRGVAPGRPACQRATRALRCATALRVTHSPPLRSDSSFGPCGPAWTGASRPFTPSRGGRGEGRALAWGVRSRSAQTVANAGASSVEGIDNKLRVIARRAYGLRSHGALISMPVPVLRMQRTVARLYPLLFKRDGRNHGGTPTDACPLTCRNRGAPVAVRIDGSRSFFQQRDSYARVAAAIITVLSVKAATARGCNRMTGVDNPRRDGRGKTATAHAGTQRFPSCNPKNGRPGADRATVDRTRPSVYPSLATQLYAHRDAPIGLANTPSRRDVAVK